MGEGKLYAPLRVRSFKDKCTGERKLVEAIKRVKQWWFVAEKGACVFASALWHARDGAGKGREQH
jgi:hypothetical protein